MGSRKFLGGMAACAASVAVAVSGCGAQGPAAPSGLDPARMAPTGSLAYVSVTVRPQGAEATQVEAALHKLFGASTDQVIRRQADKLFHQAGTTYTRGVQKWLGQRIGVVVTGLTAGSSSTVSKSDVALVAPTSDTADARAFIQRALKHSPDAAGGILGQYAVFGGVSAFKAIGAVAAGAHSLASSPAYQSSTAVLPSNAIATAYVNLRGYAQAFASMPQAALLGPFLRQSMSRLSPDAALVMALTASGSQVALDFDETGVKHAPGPSVPASVADLPASSWLALAIGGGPFSAQAERRLQAGFHLGLAAALSRAGAAGGAAAALVGQRLGFIENDVLPALGPLTLSVSGTSPLGLGVGLQLRPHSMAAADRLLGMLRSLAARNAALQVSGSATNFTIRVPTGSQVTVTSGGGRVVLTYGYSGQQAFLHPASTLSADPTYQHAVSQLPPGSSVPLYLQFAPITTLVQLTSHSPNAAKTVAVLRKLSYVIAGGSAGHDRIVLGLN